MSRHSKSPQTLRSSALFQDTWVVVPAFNEEKYLAAVLKKILAITPQVIVVDDGSKDATAFVAKKIIPHALSHQVNLGKGAALKTGCDWAFDHLNAKFVVVLDGDDQHDPSILPDFVRALLNQKDVVFGVRDFQGMPLIRKLGNQVGSIFVWFLFGRYLPDIPSGYKAFSKHAYQTLRWKSLGYSVEMEIAARVAKSNLSVVAVPIPTIYHDFTRGMTLLDTLAMIWQVISWRVSL